MEYGMSGREPGIGIAWQKKIQKNSKKLRDFSKKIRKDPAGFFLKNPAGKISHPECNPGKFRNGTLAFMHHHAIRVA
jgi:hypothetical protein